MNYVCLCTKSLENKIGMLFAANALWQRSIITSNRAPAAGIGVLHVFHDILLHFRILVHVTIKVMMRVG